MAVPTWESVASDPRFGALDAASQERMRIAYDRLVPAKPVDAARVEPSLTRRALALTTRIAAPIVGGTAGFFTPVPGGTYLGAAVGGAAGEALAEKIEGQDLDPKEIALSGVVSALPAGRFAGVTRMGPRIALRASQGALTGAGTQVARDVLHGETPDVGDAARSAVFGGVLGAGAGALEARLGGRRAPTRTVEPTPKPAPAPESIPGLDDVEAPPMSPAVDIPPPTTPPPTKTGPKALPKFKESPTADAPSPPVDTPEASTRPPSGYFRRLPGDEPVPPPQPRPAERYAGDVESIDRLFPGIAPETRANLVQLEQQHAELIGERTRGKQSVARTQALASELYPDLNKMLPKGTVPNAEQITAIGSAVGDLTEQLDDLGKQIAAGTADTATKLRWQILQGQLVNQVASFRGGRAELGRGLGILRYQIDALKSGDPRFIDRALKRGVPPEQVAKALRTFDPSDDIGRYRFLLAAQKPSFRDYARWYYFTSILSGPKTHERNLIGNTMNLIYRPASSAAAGIVERLRGVPIEQRHVFAGEAPRQAYAALSAMREGTRRALYFFKNGFSPVNVGDFEVRPPEVAGGVYTNFIGRALGSADEFFKTLAGSMELHGGAYAMAYREAAENGVPGPTLRPFLENRIADLVAEPTPALLEQVKQAATRATFQEGGGKFVQALYAAREAVPLLDFVIPFIRTPAAIFRQGIQASPVGFATKLGRESGRLGAQARGEAALGSLLLAPLAYLAATGQVSGSGPKDPRELDRLRATGWQPNSIKIGDRWINYSLIQPLAVPLSIIANLFESGRENWGKMEPEQLAGAAFGKVANSALQQSYLQGLFDAMEAISDPDRKGAAFIRRYATAAIPLSAAARTVRQLQDPVIRTPTTLAEGIGLNLPENTAAALGFPTAQPKVRATGELVERENTLRVPEVTRTQTDPIREEVGRLAGVDLMKELSIPEQRRALAFGRQQVPITPDSGTALRQAQGQAVRAALTRAIQSPTYQRMPDPVRAERLKAEIRHARKIVLDRAKQLTAQRRPLTTDQLIPPGMRSYLSKEPADAAR